MCHIDSELLAKTFLTMTMRLVLFRRTELPYTGTVSL